MYNPPLLSYDEMLTRQYDWYLIKVAAVMSLYFYTEMFQFGEECVNLHVKSQHLEKEISLGLFSTSQTCPLPDANIWLFIEMCLVNEKLFCFSFL